MAANPLLLISKTGTCLQANAAARQLWQCSEGPPVGCSLADLMGMSASDAMPLLELRPHEVYEGEGWVTGTAGQPVPVSFTLQADCLPNLHLLSLQVASLPLTPARFVFPPRLPAISSQSPPLPDPEEGQNKWGEPDRHLFLADCQPQSRPQATRETPGLPNSEALLKGVLDSAHAAIVQFKFFADQTCEYTYLSEGVEAVLGYPKQRFMEDPQFWLTHIYPADLATQGPQICARIMQESPWKFEYRFRGPQNSLRWISSCLTSHYDEAAGYWLVTTVEINISDRKQVELALVASEHRFRSILENMPLLGVLLDPDGTLTLCNDSMLELTGWSRDEVLQKNWVDIFIPPEFQAATQRLLRVSGMAGDLPRHSEMQILTRWGERRLVAWRHLVLRDEHQQPIEYACIGEDITDRRRTETSLQKHAVQAQIIADITRQVRQTLDLQTILATAVSTLKAALDADRVLIFQFATVGTGKIVADTDNHPVVSLEQSTHIASWFDRTALPDEIEMVYFPILRITTTPKRQVWGLLMVYLPAPLAASAMQGQAFLRPLAEQLAIAIHQSELYTQAQQELQERQQVAIKFQHDALHDPLTGLQNRLSLTQTLEHLLALPRRSFALLFLDLNRFKEVNDTFGHRMGDQLLQVVAQRLQFCIRDTDLAVRLGGDEFILLLNPISCAADAIEVAQRVHQALAAPTSLLGSEVAISASIGIAIGSDTYVHPDELIADADRAMYEAKRCQKSYIIYGSDAPSEADEKSS